MSATYPYEPDYAVRPGAVLEERMTVRGLSPTELARRCDTSATLISGIISGDTPIDSEMARRLERVLDLDFRIWLGIEANYRAHVARSAEKRPVAQAAT